jgi:DNA-binding SARP family transcriptional activator
MTLLATGEFDSARSIAERILPQAEAISAMGHVLHARMILAGVALNDRDPEEAVRQLLPICDHILECSPVLTVACYVRALPQLLAPLSRAMGVSRVPVRVLRLLPGHYWDEAIAAAEGVLTDTEVRRLKARVAQDAERRRTHDAAEAAKPVLCEVRLFGGLHVKAPHGVVGERDWTKRKSRLLFSMLVARGGTDVHRGEIIDYLWPDMDEERGLSNFYVVWSAMKRALSPRGSEQGSPFVQHAHGVCRIVSEHVVSDLDLFKAAVGRARVAHAEGDARTELEALKEALALYRGDVLPGDVYDDWFGAVREHFKHDYEDAALRAGRLFTELGEPLEGLSMLRDASTHNPWREDLYQEMLKLQIATGQRAAAIETYLTCRARLVDDLGIDPSRETVALYEQVLGMEDRGEWNAGS